MKQNMGHFNSLVFSTFKFYHFNMNGKILLEFKEDLIKADLTGHCHSRQIGRKHSIANSSLFPTFMNLHSNSTQILA
jgi:hypothetical protein